MMIKFQLLWSKQYCCYRLPLRRTLVLYLIVQHFVAASEFASAYCSSFPVQKIKSKTNTKLSSKILPVSTVIKYNLTLAEKNGILEEVMQT